MSIYEKEYVTGLPLKKKIKHKLLNIRHEITKGKVLTLKKKKRGRKSNVLRGTFRQAHSW